MNKLYLYSDFKKQNAAQSALQFSSKDKNTGLKPYTYTRRKGEKECYYTVSLERLKNS